MSALQRNRRLALLGLVAILLPAGAAAGQTRHHIFNQRNRFVLENRDSRRQHAFDMWSTRLANAAFDPRFTDRVVASLDDYLRYGVNTLSVGIQGGNLGSTEFNKRYPAVYDAAGALKLESVVWANLRRLLAETDRRGMVLIIGYWYFKRDQDVPTEAAALEATRRVTEWLKATGHRNYILDLVNEFGHTEYDGRALFTTVTGALKLLHAVYEVDPDVLAGMSPPGRLFSPEGYLDTPGGKTWVAARVTYSHNQPADPRNPASYYLHGLPGDPLGKPYVNNEFNAQLGYEKYLQRDPRTGLDTLGHWDRQTVERYVADLQQIRELGGYGNVFSHHQQYLTRDRDLPVAEVGPGGEQPEATPGGGEPSMHWLFEAIAAIRKAGPTGRRHDFNDTLGGGLDTTLEGTWTYEAGELRQTDARHPLAWARAAVAGGALEVGFEAGFVADPGPSGRLGVQLGAATPAGPAYRLLVGAGELTLDQPGGKLPLARVAGVKNERDRYRLAVGQGRIRVQRNGRTVIDVEDIAPVSCRNLVLLTQSAGAAFDNLRVGPSRLEDFEDGDPSAWTAADSRAWTVVADSPPAANKLWQAAAGATGMVHAYLDGALDDFAFGFEARLAAASFVGVRFRAAGVESPAGDGYLLRLLPEGSVLLDRLRGAGLQELGYGWAAFDPGQVKVRIAAAGARLRVLVDDQLVLDVIDPEPPLAPGGLVLLAGGGTVGFDNLELETCPNGSPAIAVEPTPIQPLEVGMRLVANDADGTLDLGQLRVFLNRDDGHGFLEVSHLLHPIFGLFAIEQAPDNKGAVARLVRRLDIGHGERWTLRFRAVDRGGNESVLEQRLHACAGE
ncbi:MAG: hypothetical protein JXQ29_00010 [Planctomycetes bacterium]|nr:hypothetical protein [Planctomycetota bacterium]